VPFAGRPVEDDVSPGQWIADAVRHDSTVGSLVPPVFEAYARVFHPVTRFDGPDDVDVPWAEVAAANVTVAHPAMEWGSITGLMEFFHHGDQSPLWDMAPAHGHLPEHVAQRLIEVLGRHTGSRGDCWFGVWNGFGGLTADAPTLALHQEFWLVRGPLALAAENMADEPAEQSANLWWPADRAWFVASDIDLVTTYVGGSAACIADVLAHPGLEGAAVPASQGITWDADTVNPLPFDGPA
jgi:hypothetical protein